MNGGKSQHTVEYRQERTVVNFFVFFRIFNCIFWVFSIISTIRLRKMLNLGQFMAKQKSLSESRQKKSDQVAEILSSSMSVVASASNTAQDLHDHAHASSCFDDQQKVTFFTS